VLTRWTALARDVMPGADPGAVQEAGRDLLARYAEPQRHYHDQRHLAEVLAAVDRLDQQADQPAAVRLAAWFHDAVYDPRAAAGSNEEASARLAESVLGALPVEPDLVRQVAALVRMTATHEGAGADAAVLSDADLAILGADEERYAQYAAAVREEYAHVPDPAFRAGRAAILRGLTERDRIYRTPTGYAAWERTARANLATELADLSAPGR